MSEESKESEKRKEEGGRISDLKRREGGLIRKKRRG